MNPLMIFVGALKHVVSVCVVALFCVGVGVAQNPSPTASRADFVSDASFVLGTFTPPLPDYSAASMAKTAVAFLDSLDQSQRAKCVGELNSPQRREWTNLPARPDADGIPLGKLTREQTQLACTMMANLLSQQGYRKVRDIMLADDQLLKGERPRRGFGTENFSIVIFGTPSATEPWGFQLDGHHVGVNLSMEGENLTMSPSFIGTQPQAFEIAGNKYRPFKHETDLAHELATSLNDQQVLQAVRSPRRAKIVTGPGRDGHVPDLGGVSCGTFDATQKEALLALISQWVGDLPEPHASKRMQQIAKEIDQMKFGWNGNRDPGSDVSYSIQSPSLVIEYACQDLGGSPLDHLHSNYRDPTNEYGGQLK